MKNFIVSLLVVTATVASTSSAAIIVFTNQTNYDNYASESGATLSTETFESFNGYYTNPLVGSTGDVTWSASAFGGIDVGTVGSSHALSAFLPVPLTLSFSGAAVQGVSGNVYGTDSNFDVVPCIIRVSMQDGTLFIGIISSKTAFLGFYSTGSAMTEITASSPLSFGLVYPTVDNLTFAVVPAPGAIALLGIVGFARRRRR